MFIIWLSPSFEMLGNANKNSGVFCSDFIETENFQITL